MRTNKSLNERLHRFKPITSVVEGPIKKVKIQENVNKEIKNFNKIGI